MRKQSFLKNIFGAAKIVFRDPTLIFLGISFSINAFLVYYFLLLKTTTLTLFIKQNSLFYSALFFALTFLICLLFGAAASFIAWSWKNNRQKNPSLAGNGFIGGFLGNKLNIDYDFGNSSATLNANESAANKTQDDSNLLKQINPPQGYEINVAYGDIGPRLVSAGAIDIENLFLSMKREEFLLPKNK